MPRRLRSELPDGIFHVTSRGVARAPIVRDTHDYIALRTQLREVIRKFAWNVYAYCLMPNHYHLVLSTEREILRARHRERRASRERDPLRGRQPGAGRARRTAHRLALDGHRPLVGVTVFPTWQASRRRSKWTGSSRGRSSSPVTATTAARATSTLFRRPGSARGPGRGMSSAAPSETPRSTI